MDLPALTAEEYAKLLTQIRPPIASIAQHPASDRKERIRKEMEQCMECGQRKTRANLLMKCGRCKVDTYCSKECQKRTWALHKDRCKQNQGVMDTWSTKNHQKYASLCCFINKHWLVIAYAAISGVLGDHLASGNLVQSETAFFVTDIQVIPVGQVGTGAEGIRRKVLEANEEAVAKGSYGAAVALVMCAEYDITNVIPVGMNVTAGSVGQQRRKWK
ncbi:hypothetical protein GYMLUDRAFT_252067 [Collybiopsis luxurians FD-317 M1]|uniref:MYND-type domain-containing protein n=1 Tax=Collybiopsis luxurians FD-317 M1 TaxID=944289 RepID=A0A0D0C9J9_9AGAR|nr:hypothetical protein GYMLUDRAFT_252067 [Collybiopsis luxurians FD-317 M1]